MRKILTLAAAVFLIFGAYARPAHAVAPPAFCPFCVPVGSGPVSLASSTTLGLAEAGGSALFATVVFPLLVTYEVPFPLCNAGGLKCYGEYPGDKARIIQVALSSKGFGKPYHVMVDGHDSIRSDGF